MPRRAAVALAVVALAATASSTAATAPQVHLVPQVALLDAPLHVDATGLAPGVPYVVRLSTRDAERRTWQVTSAVRARNGEFHIDASKLFPRLLPTRQHPKTPLEASLFPPRHALALSVALVANGRVVAAAAGRRVIVRRLTNQMLSLGRNGVLGRYLTDGTRKRRPGVLVLGGSEGGLRPSMAAALLASHGYDTLQLAYFRADGLPAELERIPLEYFERGLRWLARRPGVDPRRLFVLGGSRGAELALILGSRFPSLVYGVAAFSPSSYVVPALDGTSPAWTHDGKPIPHATVMGIWPDPGSKEGRAAAIPVERIRGPVLLVGGDDDLVWPAGDFVRSIADRLRTHAKRSFASIVYDHAGHSVAVGVPLLPLSTFPYRGGFVEADARARTAAWGVLLRMLERS